RSMSFSIPAAPTAAPPVATDPALRSAGGSMPSSLQGKPFPRGAGMRLRDACSRAPQRAGNEPPRCGGPPGVVSAASRGPLPKKRAPARRSAAGAAARGRLRAGRVAARRARSAGLRHARDPEERLRRVGLLQQLDRPLQLPVLVHAGPELRGLAPRLQRDLALELVADEPPGLTERLELRAHRRRRALVERLELGG